MEKHVLLFTIAASAFSFSCLAQYNERFQVDLKAKSSRLIADRISQKEFTIVSYRVEEKINMKFGSTTTTYTVPSLNLINTNDLGENNTRKITPKYARAKAHVVDNGISNALVVSTNVKPREVDVVIPLEKKTYVRVNILTTYERVLEKGYLSVEMLKKVGDWRYFEGDLDIAAKWYTELLCMTTDLDAVFYYRYAQCLKSIGELDKANEMMVLFESKK
jgi:hypothetical protein